jgi:class 3 adenylate cyclase
MTATRRLVAILAADVAGYSRLIGADEEGTLNRLTSIRAEVIDPKIAEHHGRIVKTTGDGLLVEFASVVDAVRCATEWQAGMTSGMTLHLATIASSSVSALTRAISLWRTTTSLVTG